MPRLSPVLHALFCIVPIVAPLAKRREIKKAAILRAVIINMRNRKNNHAAGNRMRLMILTPAPFTTVLRPVKPDKPTT
jgi:hypothetical protein